VKYLFSKNKLTKIVLSIIIIFFILSLVLIFTNNAKDDFAPEIIKQYYTTVEFESYLYIVKLPKDKVKVGLANSSQPYFLSDWNKFIPSIAMINAAFFEKDYTPSGYLMIDGIVINRNSIGNSFVGYLVVNIDGSVRIVSNIVADKSNHRHILQGYPLLIDDGKVKLTASNDEKARRSAIGIDKNGDIYLITADNKDLSLTMFAEVISQSNIDFESVLNLDGGTSSGLYINSGLETIKINSQIKVPSVIIITKK
jgi:exopolysaccharide biosynthesis protein